MLGMYYNHLHGIAKSLNANAVSCHLNLIMVIMVVTAYRRLEGFLLHGVELWGD